MDRVCAVFGGSRGIGKVVARLMAQRGYRLAIVARNLQGARAAAGDLGGDHLALSCDVAKEHDVQNTFEEIEKNLGRVNFLVNAAGINRDNLLVRTNAEDMLSQLHTNLLGSMLTCRAAVKTMIKQQTGSIVNVGSVVGVKGSSGQSVYSASKGGLVAFSRALAKEVARKKIRVNVVAPVRHHHQALLRGAGTGAGDLHCYSVLEQRCPGGHDLGLTGLRGPGCCICPKTTRGTSHLKSVVFKLRTLKS
ncbi:3-oxoacyl-[acyl-carrier-protein] reductase isoform X2 [Globicephala melas]|uniref:3-oxoacyl-[acyl-carrier-protein] reductase isoform X2 n=1 Tax=Globicephala melas TaxID=9731 RepID=UPI00122F9821|nr:3-oxoacyl-[acyl-carrier-protein] reductase isoform X2 [Globicephala melas]